MRLRVLIGLVALMTGFAIEHADAGFRVCNKMDQRLSIAFGYVDRNRGWTAQGWWVIDVNQCGSVYEPDLDNRYYYVLAEPTAGGPALNGGKVPFCIQDKTFTLYQEQYGKSSPDECARAGLRSAAFIAIDVGAGQKNHVLNFTGSSQTSAPMASAPPPPPTQQRPPPQPPVATAPPPAPPPVNSGGGGGAGTACQRYPNLC